MGNDYFNNLKLLSNIYLKLKENKLKTLDKKLQNYKLQLEDEKSNLTVNKEYLNELLKENAMVKHDFNKLETLLKSDNNVINIKNNGYAIAMWENVFVKKTSTCYILETKKHEVIFSFSESLNYFWDYFAEHDYSIIVLSVDNYRIQLQIRLK